MTAGEAIERAKALRPRCEISEAAMKEWLRAQDGRLRAQMQGQDEAIGRGDTGADLLWAEGLDDSAELLLPSPFDGAYPHYLCAEIDAALGETERYSAEMTRCNAVLAEFMCRLRRSCPPPRRHVLW